MRIFLLGNAQSHPEAIGLINEDLLLNAQAELKLKQDTYEMSIENARTNAPLTVGSTTGDPLPDLWGQRGVEIRYPIPYSPAMAITSLSGCPLTPTKSWSIPMRGRR